VREQREVLEHQPEAALMDRHARQVAPVERHRSRVGCFQSGDDAQQRRLAAAGRAEQADDLAGVGVERDIVEDARE